MPLLIKMPFKNIHRLLYLCLFSFTCYSEAAFKRYSYEEENQSILRELRDSLEDLRHEINNHETEIRTYEEKLNNQDLIIESLRQQLVDATQGNKELIKEFTTTLGVKITSLDTTVKGIISDLRQFKTYSNESSGTFAQNKQKINELEKSLEVQNQNMDNMQVALKALMDALQIKSNPVVVAKESVGVKSYRVKTGDSLEKIARNHQTTIQLLKELNVLTNDKIIVGQTLKLP